jgi:hypothetical protein
MKFALGGRASGPNRPARGANSDGAPRIRETRDSRRVLAATSKARATAPRAPFGDPPLSFGL